ncbi:MAG: hypothetical protein JOZ96_18315 [Acidobacteria bacterium]|nr:hypothetical protein [Acidobacteriota bacterium]
MMKGLDIPLWAVGTAGTVYALYEFMRFATAKDPAGFQDVWAGVGHLYVALAAAAAAAACIVWAFVRRPRVMEEIHVTK